MNYERIYAEFIADRKLKEPDCFRGKTYHQRHRMRSVCGFEHHHILPKSHGGGDAHDNVVSLSYVDHYFSHLLLAKIYGGKMWFSVLAFAGLVGDRDAKFIDVILGRKMFSVARTAAATSRVVWDDDSILKSARRFSSTSEWKKGCDGSYQAAVKKGMLDVVRTMYGIKSMKKNNGFWSKDKCLRDALNFNTKSKWQRASGSAYASARKNGWLDDCCKHMKTPVKTRKWFPEALIADAKLYDTISEWASNSSGACDAARKDVALFAICTQHMSDGRRSKGPRKWSKDECIKSAARYNCRSDWKKSEGSAYASAVISGWLDECCSHMVRKKGATNQGIGFCCNGSAKTSGGLEWMFA